MAYKSYKGETVRIKTTAELGVVIYDNAAVATSYAEWTAIVRDLNGNDTVHAALDLEAFLSPVETAVFRSSMRQRFPDVYVA